MKHLRQYIRKIILENLRNEFENYLSNSDIDLMYSDTTDTDSATEEEISKAYRKRSKVGRVVKQAFAKYADRSFHNSLQLVHWTHKKENLESMLTNPQSRDEISVNAYYKSDVPSRGSFGKYGIIVDGYITLLANDMDAIHTGHSEFYKKADPQKAKSSGVNKGVGVVQEDDIVLDESDWNPQGLGNEALVDNWKVTGIIVPDPDYDDFVDIVMQDEIFDNIGEINIHKSSWLG